MMPRFLIIFLLLLTIWLSPAPAISAEKNQGRVYVVDENTCFMSSQLRENWISAVKSCWSAWRSAVI
jgi:hypothetical protein